jgi:hypothetical protein
MPQPLEFPVDHVAVAINYRGKKDGNEVVHTVDGEKVQIVSCTHDIKKKMRQNKDKETGDLLGFEPTGEEELIVKVKYIREV